MKDKELEELLKEKTKKAVQSYTVINPVKHIGHISESVANTIESPIQLARSNISLLKRMIGNNDRKLSYEDLYANMNANENLRQKNYTNFSLAALIMFVLMIAVFLLGCYKTYIAIDAVGMIMAIMTYSVGALVAFSVYFRCVVRAYGLKHATVENKLNALKGIDNILPNPLYDVRAATNHKDEPIAVYLETKEEQEINK
ncbi:hypothetical protein P5Y60_004362 [Salmonella enterica]|nr:hypothetical protein [Salmonella enterica]